MPAQPVTVNCFQLSGHWLFAWLAGLLGAVLAVAFSPPARTASRPRSMNRAGPAMCTVASAHGRLSRAAYPSRRAAEPAMPSSLNRRKFLETTAAAAAWAAGSYFVSEAPAQESKSANERLSIAVMGVNGRGSALTSGFHEPAELRNRVHLRRRSRAIDKSHVADRREADRKPQGVDDFRKALDDKSVDILVCAAPDHWHAPATILGCSAGKHVYVEKPCSHNPREGELAVEAARKHNRVVQMGTQRRS